MGDETTVQHRGISRGQVRFKNLGARKALDGVTFCFSCEVELNPSEPKNCVRLVEITGRVEFENAGELGPLWLLNGFDLKSSDRPEKQWATVCVAASDAAVRAIDRLRASSPHDQFTIVLWLNLRGSADDGPVDSQAILTRSVSASEWFAALSAGAFESRHVIDVPVQGGRVGGALSTAAEHYRRAIEQWRKASYAQVLTECRKVVESIRDVYQLSPKGISEWQAHTKGTWSNAECIEYARAAIHQIMHHTAHPGVSDDPGASEAELALGLTGSLLRYYASTR